MNWINIKTSDLRSAEFIGSDPTARGTWVAVLGYCYEQENAGRIKGCNAWKDRQWQQVCGVTREEIDGAKSLMNWEGEDLQVWGYPAELENEIKVKREAGRKGGQARTQAKIAAAKANGAKHNPSLTQAQPKQEPNVIVIERERVIEKKTEAVADATPVLPVSLQTSEFADAWKDWVAYRKERGQTLKPTTIKAQLGKMQDWGAADAVAAIRQSILNGWQGIFEPRSNGQPKKPGGTSTYELEARAHGYTL
jgi:hypothetical protein